MQHHDGKRQNVGGIFRADVSIVLVVLEVLESKDLHDLVNLLCFTLQQYSEGDGLVTIHVHVCVGVH